MESKFSVICTNFMNKTIRKLLYLILIGNIGAIGLSIIGWNKSTIPFLIIGTISIFIGYKIIRANISNVQKLSLILIIALTLRLLWFLNIPSVPVSDFSLINEAAISFLNGDRSMFRGTEYISRFPHLTGMLLYMALINFLFPIKSIIVMKFINLFLGLIDIILIYLITDLIFKNKIYAQISAFMASVFPPLITYTTVFCSENIAMPFYLLSIYLFVHHLRNRNSKFQLLLCGVILSIGNFFRTIATVILIAYILYVIIYSLGAIYEKLRDIVILIISYISITLIISTTLQSLNIIEKPLWKPSESKITSVLKGSNYKSFGRFNSEDADFINEHLDNYEELKEKSKEIILDRYKSHSIFDTTLFLIEKFTLQWSVGDFEGHFWAQTDVPEEDIKFPIKQIEGSLAFQLIYFIIVTLVFIGLKNDQVLRHVKEANLLYLIIGGYGLTYLITETQGRYSYICCYIIIFLSIAGVDSVMQKFKTKSRSGVIQAEILRENESAISNNENVF
ncbi:glycosyltransferase family 39 protein [Clostridium sp. SHJSY1]|uniref:glycosyltransferase family 39 protein n=1 Tax=Clostridium sp. SHJSY1 TaxID=2942483 RepID=UPI0028760D15|nr:glycosyltransferase family 39 protein [Clostridium sp. SHJSY1]MDS0526004.1 glycosyltransferase family 39 protein [Clostridium sp. SHJSY1]